MGSWYVSKITITNKKDIIAVGAINILFDGLGEKRFPNDQAASKNAIKRDIKELVKEEEEGTQDGSGL